MNKFDANKIISATVVNPMVDMESISTDYITENFFKNDDTRYNFYYAITELYKYHADSVLVGEMAQYKEHIYLVFKGGNIIKAIIDKSEKNIRRTIAQMNDDKLLIKYSLDEYNKTKRSDSDFGIMINYIQVKNMNSNLDENALANKYMNILVGCEKIAYNVMNDIRRNYEHITGMVSINIPGKQGIQLKISDMRYDDNLLNKLIDSYNTKYDELVALTSEQMKKMNDISSYEFVSHNKNIVTKMMLVCNDKTAKYEQRQNYNDKYSAMNMPRISGIVLNDNIKYNVDQITPLNSMSLDELLSKLMTTIENIDKTAGREITANRNDMEINYMANNIPVISDDNGLKMLSLENKNNEYYGYVINSDISNPVLFSNVGKITQRGRSKINATSIKSIPNNSPLFISTNRTLRFVKGGVLNTAFNLVRTKHNFRIYFELPRTIMTSNMAIRYVYISVPGEFIDMAIPTYGDSGLISYIENIPKYITTRTINNSMGNSTKIYTYSTYGLIHDIESILYETTKDRPWTDKKYTKRLERLFRLYIAIIKDDVNTTIADDIVLGMKYVIDVLKNMIKTDNYRQVAVLDDILRKIANVQSLSDMFNEIFKPYNLSDNVDNTALKDYTTDIIKYLSIMIENIDLPSKGNLDEIQLGGYYAKYMKYKQKYMAMKKQI